jgi:hypothetical protein
MRNSNNYTRDPRGFDRVDMPRNNQRAVQASSFLFQGWRGNCDIQYLLYSSEPDEIDVSDITRVTNYVVSYSCKGNKTEIQEKAGLKSIVDTFFRIFRIFVVVFVVCFIVVVFLLDVIIIIHSCNPISIVRKITPLQFLNFSDLKP